MWGRFHDALWSADSPAYSCVHGGRAGSHASFLESRVFGRLQTLAGVLIPLRATQLPWARLSIQSAQGNADLIALVQFPHFVL